YNTTGDYQGTVAQVLRALGLAAPVEDPSAPALLAPQAPTAATSLDEPAELLPSRLASHGYQARVLHGIPVILPPLCDVPTGAFLMGSDPTQEPDARHWEQPQHWVTLPTYQIARFPVTIAEYACFVRIGYVAPGRMLIDRPSWKRQLERPDHPVINVSWHDAVPNAAWLARLT